MLPVSSLSFGHLGSRLGPARFMPALLVAASLLAGCNKDAPPVAAEPQPASARGDVGAATTTPAALTAGASEPATPAATPATANLSEESFDLGMVPKGEYAVGKPAEVEVVLDAKDPYKVNDKYPYKLKLKETPGLKYASLVVGKEQVKLEKKRATVAVPFTPEKAGKHAVTGQFAFSVCTDDKCLIERRDLSLTIEAK